MIRKANMKYSREITKLSVVIVISIFIALHLFRDTPSSSQNPNHVTSFKFDVEDQENIRYLTGRKKDNTKENVEKLMNTDSIVEENIKNKNASKYVQMLEDIRNPKMRLPKNIEHISGYIDIGFILINLKRTKHFNANMEFKITRTFNTMISYSSGSPLHFIIITDPSSVTTVAMFFSHFISKRVSEAVIVEKSWRKKMIKGVPPIKISFTNIEDIKNLNYHFIDALKRNTEAKDDEKVDKYSSDLFYIGPLYYKAFIKLDKLIFLDATDLEFYDDISKLYALYNNIKEELMGVAVDKSPHYRKQLKRFLEENPDSPLGLPGDQQGLNTGVVLYHLENMRNNKEYQKSMEPDKVDELIQKYKYNMTLGDQDWFTNLAWEKPESFYILPCQFNAQTSIQYLKPPWEEVFDNYHFCDNKTNLKIVHRNGCGPLPQLCGITPDPNSPYWQDKKNFFVDMHVNIEALWLIIRDLILGQAEFKVWSYL